MASKTRKKNMFEIDKDKIIHPEDVETNRDLKNYFRQRLGADFTDLPFVYIEREAYMRLIHGEDALLSKMIVEDESAAKEIFLAYAGDKLNRVIMTFNIEKATVGNRSIEFIRKHKKTPEHEVWLVEMEQLSFKIQKLHHQWKKNSFRYHPLSDIKSPTAFKAKK